MDRERGKIGESSSLTDQGYQTLMNPTSDRVVEALMRSLVIVEGEVALESDLQIGHCRFGADNTACHPHSRWRALSHQQEYRDFFAAHRDQLTVFQLPWYSPNYNPIEFLWRQVKQRATHNQYFPQFDDLIAAGRGGY